MGDQSNPPKLSGVKIPQEEEVEAETSGSKDAEEVDENIKEVESLEKEQLTTAGKKLLVYFR